MFNVVSFELFVIFGFSIKWCMFVLQVDDSNLTLAMVGQTVAAVFGTTHEFYNMAMSSLAEAKTNFSFRISPSN